MSPSSVVDVLRKGAWWAADYAYVTWWQVAGLVRRARADDWLRPEPRVEPAVLLLPGVYETWKFMHPLAGALHERGHAVHVVDRLGLNAGAIPAAADLVAAQILAEDLRDVVVVAHSKGGLIGKTVMGRPDVGDRIAGMVAINTPFAGSPYARWIPLRSVRTFHPADEVLTALQAQQVPNSLITSVYTRFDPHIPGGSELVGAHNVQLATPGHFRVLSDPELVPLLVEELTRRVRR